MGCARLLWKYAAGKPNIIGTIVAAQALRLLLDLALAPTRAHCFGSDLPIEREAVAGAMGRVTAWSRQLTARALERLGTIPGITIYGPRDASHRSSLVAFNVKGRDPVALARALADIVAGRRIKRASMWERLRPWRRTPAWSPRP